MNKGDKNNMEISKEDQELIDAYNNRSVEQIERDILNWCINSHISGGEDFKSEYYSDLDRLLKKMGFRQIGNNWQPYTEEAYKKYKELGYVEE